MPAIAADDAAALRAVLARPPAASKPLAPVHRLLLDRLHRRR
jgi:hypothetical protein